MLAHGECVDGYLGMFRQVLRGVSLVPRSQVVTNCGGIMLVKGVCLWAEPIHDSGQFACAPVYYSGQADMLNWLSSIWPVCSHERCNIFFHPPERAASLEGLYWIIKHPSPLPRMGWISLPTAS